MSSEQLRKVEKVKPFGHSRAPKNKKLPHFDNFPRPGEIDPYRHFRPARIVPCWLVVWWLWRAGCSIDRASTYFIGKYQNDKKRQS